MTAEHDAQQPRGYWCREGYHGNCKGVIFATELPCACECHGKERKHVRRPTDVPDGSVHLRPSGGGAPDDAGPAATLGSVQHALDGLAAACRQFAEQEGIKASGWLLRDVLTDAPDALERRN